MLIDTHLHLDEFDDIEDILDRARGVGVSDFVSVGYNIESSRFSLSVARRFQDVFALLGIHPHDAGELTEEFLTWLSEATNDKKVLGIGEIGLDYYRNLSPRGTQIDVFERQLSLAQELSIPVSLHIRDAYREAFSILKGFDVRGVLHCYSGGISFLEEALSSGFFIGFDGPVTFHNAKETIEVVKRCPLERILIETDAPYLAPEPFRGKRNEPANLIYIARKISEIKEIEIEELEKILEENVKKCFPRYALQ